MRSGAVYSEHQKKKKQLKGVYEPPNDKTNKMTVRPAKTQISLVSLRTCAQWVAKDQSFLHADTEDSDQTGRMARLI